MDSIRNWNEYNVESFMRFNKSDHVFLDDFTERKLVNAGLAAKAGTKKWGEPCKLTQQGKELLAYVNETFESGDLSRLPVAFRMYYLDWVTLDIEAFPDEKLREMFDHDRSPRIRDNARMMGVLNGIWAAEVARLRNEDVEFKVAYVEYLANVRMKFTFARHSGLREETRKRLGECFK